MQGNKWLVLVHEVLLLAVLLMLHQIISEIIWYSLCSNPNYHRLLNNFLKLISTISIQRNQYLLLICLSLFLMRN